MAAPSGMTRGKALVLGLAFFGLGGVGYGLFQLAGFGEASAGIAAEAVLIVIVIGWIGSYLFRVVTGNMTYMQQRREYRSRYEAATEDELQKQFEALPPAEQEKLLRELGQLSDSADL
jgi:hypothetical protein